MLDPIRVGRLVVLMATVLVLNHVAMIVLVVGSKAWTFYVQTGTLRLGDGVGDWLFPYWGDLEWPVMGATMGLELGIFSMLVGCSFLVPALLMWVFTQSMSRVGVRPVHLVRGAAYMLPATGPAVFVLTGLFIAAGASTGAGVPQPVAAGAILGVVCVWPILQVLYWRAFVKRYLRMPHATGVAVSMFVILVLVLLISALTMRF